MNERTRNGKLIIIAILTAVIVAISLFLVCAPIKSASALNTTTITSATKAGGGAELWDSGSSSFNSEVMDDLLDKLFGDKDPVTYIKTMKDAPTDSYVIPASTINANVGNATYGMTVKLGGMEWMAASMTLADIDGDKDNVILTLYLANDYKTASQYYTSSTNTKGNNVYSRSTLRSNLLNWADFKLFSDKTAGGFASQYLVQPKYIKYQQTETQYGRTNPVGGNYNLPNDALGALSTGWYNANYTYTPADTYGGVRYDAWGEDYIWIPSATETGFTNYLQTSCIWKLSDAQRAHNTQSNSWLRSGRYSTLTTMRTSCSLRARMTTVMLRIPAACVPRFT